MTARELRHAARARRLLRALLAAGALALGVQLATGIAPDPVVRASGGVLLLGGLGACLARAVLVRRDRAAWTALTSALGVWTAGWVGSTVAVALTGERPVPSPADALYLAFYPAAYVGLVLLVRGQARHFPPSLWLDGLTGATAVGALGAVVLGGLVTSDGAGPLAVAVSLAYPLGDLVLLALVVSVLALRGWRPERAWWALASGLALFAVADAAYALRAAEGGDGASLPLGVLWVLSALLLGAGAWAPQPAAPPALRLDGWRVLAAPLALAALGVGLLVAGQSGQLPPAAAALATATLVLVMVRTALTFRENLRLLDAERQAVTDELTGLANRRHLVAHLAALLDDAGPRPAPVGLLLVDLDRFKELNDTLGHHAGDLLLAELGARLRGALPGADLVARLGGDEFAVVLRGGPGRDVGEGRLAAAAAALHRGLEAPFALEDLEVAVGASVGGALAPEHGTGGAELLQRADVAMYEAKRAGSGYELYRPERDLHSRERLALTHELRRGIAAGELVLHFQPKGELPTGAVQSVEALVRWAHPQRGLLPPGAFLPVAEETGLVRLLTLRVLEDALDQVAAWAAEGLDLAVAVNVSMPDLLDPRLPEDVARLLSRAGVAPERLALEVTEDIVMADPERVLGVLGRLRDLGVRLALDDFGTGRSSLAHLKRLPLHELKIDRSLIRGIAHDPADAAIVRATVDLARTLGLRVVAEGVEDRAAWDALVRLGCHALQGFGLCRPLAAEQVPAWIAAHGTGAGASAVTLAEAA